MRDRVLDALPLIQLMIDVGKRFFYKLEKKREEEEEMYGKMKIRFCVKSFLYGTPLDLAEKKK